MNPSTTQTGTRGRPAKPGRVRLNAFVPRPLRALLETDAAANGMPMSDRLAEILAAWYSGHAVEEAMPKAS